MESLVIYGVSTQIIQTLSSKIKPLFDDLKIIRADLAWELFLGERGINISGLLTLPEGNPRVQWFDINNWLHQTISSHSDMISDASKKSIAFLPNSTPDVLEFFQRTISIYSSKVGILNLNHHHMDELKFIEVIRFFFEEGCSEFISDCWVPPVMNYKEAKTSLFEKSSKQKGDGNFTWLSGFLGSDRLFTQFYHLPACSSGNRMHSHSDVDEMFLVLEGDGIVKTNRKDFAIKKGDIITKPRGSGMQTKFVAGNNGILILDIEVWSHVDQTDVVHYSEYNELFLRGKGLNYAISTDGSVCGDDLMKHYNDLYKRLSNGRKEFY